MNSSHIQRTTELVIGQGDEDDHDFDLKDKNGVIIDTSGATVTNIKFHAFEFWDDLIGAAKITLTGTHIATGTGKFRITFAKATTQNLAPGSYIMIGEATVNGEKKTFLKDNLTILRSTNV